MAPGPVAAAIRSQLDARGGEFADLRAAYAARGYAPVWITADAGARLDALQATLRGAALDGLDPGRYALAADEARAAASDPDSLARLDLTASGDFLRLVLDLRGAHPDSLLVRDPSAGAAPKVNATVVLHEVASTSDIAGYAASHAPANRLYASMKKALAHYRSLQKAGGWPAFPAGRRLEPGDEGERVVLVRKRLFATGDLLDAELESRVYDEPLAEAVRGFQRRHGLAEDAIIGPRTQAALGASVDERIEQIIANLERARWLPEDMGRRHVLVNVPGFELEVVEDGHVVMAMDIIVGRRYRATPIYSSTLTRLEFNPRWYVPESIARKDLLPKLQEDPYHMLDTGLRIFDRYTREELGREDVDWYGLSTDEPLPVLMRQDPGPENALGRVKFLFPNPFAVYLHDTPSQHLFNKSVRTFSSGCIRIERPLEMAEYLLRGASGWDRLRFDDVLATGQVHPVDLPEPVQVHLVYRTAWMDEDGRVQFRLDVYGRDAYMADKLIARRAAVPGNDA